MNEMGCMNGAWAGFMITTALWMIAGAISELASAIRARPRPPVDDKRDGA
jgi:hypothetical protein